MLAVKWVRAAACLDADMQKMWSGNRRKMVKMTVIGGNPAEVVEIPSKMAFLMIELVCMVMCFHHIEFCFITLCSTIAIIIQKKLRMRFHIKTHGMKST